MVDLFGAGDYDGFAQLSRSDKGDVVGDAEAEYAMRIGYGCEGQVGEGVDDSTLTHSGTIKMPRSDGELGRGITFAHFGELCANAFGKLVVVVKTVFKSHRWLCKVGFGEEGKLFEHDGFFGFFGRVGTEHEYPFAFPKE